MHSSSWYTSAPEGKRSLRDKVWVGARVVTVPLSSVRLTDRSVRSERARQGCCLSVLITLLFLILSAAQSQDWNQQALQRQADQNHQCSGGGGSHPMSAESQRRCVHPWRSPWGRITILLSLSPPKSSLEENDLLLFFLN